MTRVSVPLWLIDFAAFWSIKDHPDGKIVAEVFKVMWDAGRREQQIVRSECLPLVAANKLPGALRDNVNFVA